MTAAPRAVAAGGGGTVAIPAWTVEAVVGTGTGTARWVDLVSWRNAAACAADLTRRCYAFVERDDSLRATAVFTSSVCVLFVRFVSRYRSGKYVTRSRIIVRRGFPLATNGFLSRLVELLFFQHCVYL